jgi:hypothetical protein
MIDISSERLILLSAAAAYIPGRPHSSTLFRWWRDGSRGIKLESLLVGGRRYTSVEAIERFIQRLSSPHSEQHDPRRGQSNPAIGQHLDQLGIK